MVQGVADGRVPVAKPGDGRVRIHHARPGRELYREQVFAIPHKPRSGVAVEMDDAAVVRNQRLAPDSIRGGIAERKLLGARQPDALSAGGHHGLL